MTILDLDKKYQVMEASMWALIDEFFSIYHRPPLLHEFPNFVEPIMVNREAILKIIDERTRLDFLLSSQIEQYPEFWEDFLHNVRLEKIPQSIRPNRRISGN